MLKDRINKRLKQLGKKSSELMEHLDISNPGYYHNMKKKAWKLWQLESISSFLGCEAWELLKPDDEENKYTGAEEPQERYGNNCKKCERLESEVQYLREQNTLLIKTIGGRCSREALEIESPGEDTG